MTKPGRQEVVELRGIQRLPGQPCLYPRVSQRWRSRASSKKRRVKPKLTERDRGDGHDVKRKRKSAAATRSATCHLLSPTMNTLSSGTNASTTTMLSLAVAFETKARPNRDYLDLLGKKAKARMTCFLHLRRQRWR